MRLIDADALVAELKWLQSQVSSTSAMEIAEYIGRINAPPTVEAVLLPCKPGTTVHEVSNNTDACYDCRYYTGFCGDEYCDHPKHETEYPTIQDFPVCEKQFLEVISYAATEQQLFDSRKKFGKLIFLTSAEAEAALAKRRNEHET